MFLASATLYVATSARTVTGEDAGEFLAAAHVFGVPHPPGYPLWLLLSWLADHALPFGTTAFRVTLVSSLPSAAAVALLLALVLKLCVGRVAACGAAALFAVSLTHWTQAVIPEVYGLNTAFIALQLLLLVRLAEAPSARRLLVLAGVTGLSATNHTTAMPVAAIMVVAALAVAPGLFRRVGLVAGAIAVGLAPLVLYLVLPLASARDPYIDWGDPKTPAALWAHVTRAKYAATQAEQQSAGDHGDYLQRLGILGRAAARQFGSGWLLVLAAVGVVVLFVRQTGPSLVVLVLGWLCSVGVTRFTAFPFDREHVYANSIFWIPAWFALAYFFAGGLDAAIRGAGRMVSSRASPRGVALVPCIAGVLLTLLVVPTGVAHSRIADRSGTTSIERYGRAMLEVLPSGTLYFPSSDHSTFAPMYAQAVLGVRRDVVFADKYGILEPSVLEPLLGPAEREQRARLPGSERRAYEENVLISTWPGPVAFVNRRNTADLPGRTLVPWGPVYLVMETEEAQAIWQPDADGRIAGLSVLEPFSDLLAIDAAERVDFTVQMVHNDMLFMRGPAALAAGDLDAALSWWERMEGDLAPLKQLHNNAGSALAEAGRTDEALAFYARALAEDPRYRLALRNSAITHRNRGEAQLAIEALTVALAAYPLDSELRWERARLLATSGRPIEALADYEALAVGDPRDPRPWREAGDVLARGGDVRKAKDAWREALRLAPGDGRTAEKLAQLDAGGPPMEPLTSSGPAGLPLEDDHGMQPARPPSLPGPFPVAPDHPEPLVPAFDGWNAPPNRQVRP